jgi:hypothetical protein
MTEEEKKKKQQDEWMRLVHEGSCCALEDHDKEAKAKLLKDIKKESEKSKS